MRYKTLLPKATLLSVLMASMLLLGAPGAHAAPKPTSINLVPTITSITVQNGQLVASGVATAVIHGKPATAPFSNVPVRVGCGWATPSSLIRPAFLNGAARASMVPAVQSRGVLEKSNVAPPVPITRVPPLMRTVPSATPLKLPLKTVW